MEIAIIGVLISLLLPAVQKIREAANRTQCLNASHQTGWTALVARLLDNMRRKTDRRAIISDKKSIPLTTH